jgi:hypothetical protein
MMVATLRETSRTNTDAGIADEQRPTLRLLEESTTYPSTTDFSIAVATKVRDYLFVSWLNDWTLMEGRWATWQHATFLQSSYADTDDTMDDTPVLFESEFSRPVTFRFRVADPAISHGPILEEPAVEYDEPVLFEPESVRTVSVNFRVPRPS